MSDDVAVPRPLRPDQLLRQRRDAAAAKRLAELQRPKVFKPIVLLGDKKRKDPEQCERCRYCEKCHRKYRLKPGVKTATNCIDCGTKLLSARSRTEMNRIVRRLKKARRLLQATTTKKLSYSEYLKSKLWRRIRKRILKRDQHTCRDCGCTAEHVHHLSYGPLVMSGKDDSQLVSLCVPCHDARHPDKPRMSKRK